MVPVNDRIDYNAVIPRTVGVALVGLAMLAGACGGNQSGETPAAGDASTSSQAHHDSGEADLLDSGLRPGVPPSSNFDLTVWYLTLPTGTAGSPDTVSTTVLENGYAKPPYFYTGEDGSMVFWCPIDGAITMGSVFPRTELRETKGGSLFNWFVDAGTAKLDATLLVHVVPDTGKIVVGQIHDVGTGGIHDEPLVELEYDYDAATATGSLVAMLRPAPSPASSEVVTPIATDVPLDQRFDYQILLSPAGVLIVTVNGRPLAATIDTSTDNDAGWGAQGLYFKAGDYVQENGDASTVAGQVQFYSLVIQHLP